MLPSIPEIRKIDQIKHNTLKNINKFLKLGVQSSCCELLNHKVLDVSWNLHNIMTDIQEL